MPGIPILENGVVQLVHSPLDIDIQLLPVHRHDRTTLLLLLQHEPETITSIAGT